LTRVNPQCQRENFRHQDWLALAVNKNLSGENGMDVNGIAKLATTMSETRNSQEVGVAVLKKALDISASNAATLIASVPMPQTQNLPAHLGKNVDTTA
jgi:prephenate dehydrogenase